MWYYSPTKNQLIYQVRGNTYDFWLSGQYWKYFYSIPCALFPQKWCAPSEFFVLISHCSTQIWRIRYGGSWSIYFLHYTILRPSWNLVGPLLKINGVNGWMCCQITTPGRSIQKPLQHQTFAIEKFRDSIETTRSYPGDKNISFSKKKKSLK